MLRRVVAGWSRSEPCGQLAVCAKHVRNRRAGYGPLLSDASDARLRDCSCENQLPASNNAEGRRLQSREARN